MDAISRSWREISYSRTSPKGGRGFESCPLHRRVSNELYRRWASMEPGRDSRSPLRSQGLDDEVEGGNLCKMQNAGGVCDRGSTARAHGPSPPFIATWRIADRTIRL